MTQLPYCQPHITVNHTSLAIAITITYQSNCALDISGAASRHSPGDFLSSAFFDVHSVTPLSNITPSFSQTNVEQLRVTSFLLSFLAAVQLCRIEVSHREAGTRRCCDRRQMNDTWQQQMAAYCSRDYLKYFVACLFRLWKQAPISV